MQQHLHLLARMRRNPIILEQVQTVYRKSKNLCDILDSGLVKPRAQQIQYCVPCRDTHNKEWIELHTQTQ